MSDETRQYGLLSYEAPRVRVVQCRVERGLTSSGVMQPTEFASQQLLLEADYHPEGTEYTSFSHEQWQW